MDMALLCCRCHKNRAVLFVTRMDNGEMKNEGYCLKCAKELGLKPVDDLAVFRKYAPTADASE